MHRANRKSLIKLVLMTLGVALTLCAGCSRDRPQTAPDAEFAIEKAYTEGALSVKLKLSADRIEISGLLILQIEATTGPGYEVRMPNVSETLTRLAIRDWRSLGEKLDRDNKIVRTHRYRLEPLAPPRASVGGLLFEFWPDSAAEPVREQLTTEAIEIEVTSLLEELGTDLVIEDIEDVVEIRPSRLIWWIVAGTVIVLAAAGVLWYRLRPKKDAAIARIFRPAHEIAYEILRKLAEDKLIEAGRIKEFYERLSDCLRHYIEHRFRLRAPERTTEEFLIELKDTEALAAEYRNDLQRFLEHCDLVKFARYEPSADQITRTLKMVEDFVDKTMSDECKVEITEPTAVEAPAE